MTRRGSRDGTHFRKKLLNADGPVERILILLVIAVVSGVTMACSCRKQTRPSAK